MRLKNLILWDFKFQLRYGIIFASIIMIMLWIAIIYLLPSDVMFIAIPVIFITDFAVTGFLFVSAMIFLEKGQQTLQALVVTPVKLKEYLISKLVSLSVLLCAIGMIMAIAIIILKDININLFVLVIAGIFACSFFILLGINISTFFKSFTDLILPMGVLFAIMFIPFLSYVNSSIFDILDYFIIIFPTYSMIQLINASMAEIELSTVLISCGYLLFLNVILFNTALKLFNQKIVRREG
ncbi:hypothetical protein AN644_02310 [Candidatus Epulonipiscium fishelsonii]|nr:hypothetical protein AN644_02310 [Epulopiscium sp. SCG-C06WGA-EpuloA1]